MVNDPAKYEYAIYPAHIVRYEPGVHIRTQGTFTIASSSTAKSKVPKFRLAKKQSEQTPFIYNEPPNTRHSSSSEAPRIAGSLAKLINSFQTSKFSRVYNYKFFIKYNGSNS